MKQAKRKPLIIVFAAVLLCVGYFALPIRPAMAELAANRYLQSHYPQYQFPPVALVSTGFRQYYALEWVESYGAQSLNTQYTAYVELNGLFPFLVEKSTLWETRNGETVQIDPDGGRGENR